MNNSLTHEQAIQLLHEPAQYLGVEQQSDLAAHLAECDRCRAYADQIAALQPLLTQALRTRLYVRTAEPGKSAQAVLQIQRRSKLRKQFMVVVGVIFVAVFAIFAVSSGKTPGQSLTGAGNAATVTPTLAPTLESVLPTPTSTETQRFKLPWAAGVTHCVTQNHLTQGNGLGLDFDLKDETILAPQDGTVTYAGWDSEGGGYTVILSHTGGITSTYMHLSQTIVKPGVQVKQGQPLGISGATGQATGPLLHFHIMADGYPIEPSFAEAGHALKEGDCVISQNTLLVTGDRFEPNDDFDHATSIDLNVKYDQLNFAMLNPSTTNWDNDFFKIRVKPGMLITCRTSDLSGGADTNLILYDNNQNGIEGNDNVDRTKGDLSSSVTYTVTYEGWLYVLVGEGFSRSPVEAQQATYSLECSTQ